MQLLSETVKQKMKRKLWSWKPIVFFAVIGLIAFVIISDSAYTKNQLAILKSKQPIIKVEITVDLGNGIKNIVLTDSKQLDSINNAFKTAQEKDMQTGGLADTGANMNIYKADKKIDLSIHHSPYYGWMIIVGDRTLTNEYLFALVRRYSKKL